MEFRIEYGHVNVLGNKAINEIEKRIIYVSSWKCFDLNLERVSGEVVSKEEEMGKVVANVIVNLQDDLVCKCEFICIASDGKLDYGATNIIFEYQTADDTNSLHESTAVTLDSVQSNLDEKIPNNRLTYRQATSVAIDLILTLINEYAVKINEIVTKQRDRFNHIMNEADAYIAQLKEETAYPKVGKQSTDSSQNTASYEELMRQSEQTRKESEEYVAEMEAETARIKAETEKLKAESEKDGNIWVTLIGIAILLGFVIYMYSKMP